MKKIFIAEEVPSTNKGEMAILLSMLETFKVLGDVEVSMLSFHPDIDEIQYSAKIKVINAIKSLHLPNNLQGFSKIFGSISSMLQHLLFGILYKTLGLKALKFMKAEIWKEYVESDLIIIGHDAAFTTIFGYLLFSPLYIPLFAKFFLRKPVTIYAGGIGPFNRKLEKFFFAKKLAAFVLNRIDLITLREDISYKNLRKINVKNKNVFITADVAFLLKPIHHERVKEIMSQEGIDETDKPLIGMTVTRKMSYYAYPNLKNKKEKYDKHIKTLAQVVDYLIDAFNAVLVFIPHTIDPGIEHDDRIVANDIFQIVRNKKEVKVITNEYTPEELKGLIGQFDLFIGERIHSIISSTSMYVPSVCISHSSDKRRGIIGGIGQDKWIYNIDVLDPQTLISKIRDAWYVREEIKKDLMIKIKIIKERALINGMLLKNLLNSSKI